MSNVIDMEVQIVLPLHYLKEANFIVGLLNSKHAKVVTKCRH